MIGEQPSEAPALNPNNMIQDDSITNNQPEQNVSEFPGNSGNQRQLPQALRELLHTLKSTSISRQQQKQKVLQILRSNPQLMMVFMRQASYLRQQQQQSFRRSYFKA